MAILYTAFQADASGGWGADWSYIDNSSNLDADVSSGVGRLTTTGTGHYTNAQNIKHTGTFPADRGLVFKVVSSVQSADRVIYIRLSDSTMGTGDEGNTASGNGIWIEFNETSPTTPTLRARYSTLRSATLPAVSGLATVGLMVKVVRIGNTVSAKVWPADEAEPTTVGGTVDLSGLTVTAGTVSFNRSARGNNPPAGSLSFSNLVVTDGVDAVNAVFDSDTPTVSLQPYEPTVETTSDPNIAVDLSTLTMTMAAVDPIIDASTGVDLDTATLSVAAVEPTIETQQITITNLSPTEDFTVSSVNAISEGTTVRAGSSPSNVGVFKFDIPQGVQVTKVVFKYNTTNKTVSDSVQPDVALGIVENWNTSDYYNNAVTGEVVVSTALGAKTSDLTSLINPATFKGLKFYRRSGLSGMELGSKENVTVANRPTLEVSYVPSPNMIVDVPSVGITAQAQDVIVDTQKSTEIILETQTLSVAAQDVSISEGAGFTAATAAASLVANDVVVETVVSPDTTVDLATATLVVQAPEATSGAGTTIDVSDTDTVMLGSYDVDVELTNAVIVEVDTPTIEITRIPLMDVNGEPVLPTETEDPYFVATMQTLVGLQEGVSGGIGGATPTAIDPYRQQWFRMNETSGTVAYDRLYAESSTGEKVGQARLNLTNVTVGQKDGPEGRSHFYFNGDAFAAEVNGNEPRGEADQGIEFTFRTTKRTQFIMGNADAGGTLTLGRPVTWELWLVDGKLEIRTWRWGGDPAVGGPGMVLTTHTAFTDLADGEWHHVILQSGWKSWANRTDSPNSGWGLELYVDSRVEMRRRYPAVATYGFPDFIGGRPSNFYPNEDFNSSVVATDLPRSQWFVGDMTELVWRQGRALSPDEAARQRDTMFGIFAVWTQGARMTLQANEAIVKGNKPRMLVMHFGQPVDIYARSVKFSWEPNAINVLKTSPTTLVYNGIPLESPRTTEIAFVGLGDRVTHFNGWDKTQWPDTYIDKTHVWVLGEKMYNDPDNSALRTRKDLVTDNYRILDLDIDINMDDFDVISINGFPGEDADYAQYDALDANNVEPFTTGRNQLENLVEQIKDQVITYGKSLFVADPFSAIALGIVDQVDVVPEYVEMAPAALRDSRLGAVNPGFDGHAFATDPFFGAEPQQTPVTMFQRFGPGGVQNRLKAASRYTDHHANDRQRVRNLIPGLTDIVGGHIRTDTIEWMNLNPFNDPPYQLSIRYEDRSAGLQVGDTFYLDVPSAQRSEWIDSSLPSYYRATKTEGVRVASPISAIKVGKAVTSYPIYMRNGTAEATAAFGGPGGVVVGGGELDEDNSDLVGNPFYDHAISIAIEPGEVWDGRDVKGKVYVNFTESNQFRAERQHIEYRQAWEHLDEEVGPNSALKLFEEVSVTAGVKFRVSPEQARYQFSTHYGSWGGTEITFVGSAKPDWGWSAGGVRGSGLSGGGGEAMNWSWKSDYTLIPLWVPSMSERGLKWLTTDLDTGGNVNVNNETTKVNVAANDVVVETTSNAVVEVATARVNVQSYSDSDTIDPDVTVLATTPTVLFKAVGTVTDVLVDTPIMSLTTSDPEFDYEAIEWADAMVLTLPRQIAILTLEDN